MEIVDLAAWNRGGRADVARSFDEAIGCTGVIQVRNHGVDASVLDRARAVATELFELPLDEKQLCVGAGPATRGWFKPTSPDLCPQELRETFATGSQTPPPGVDDPLTFGANVYPADVPMFDVAWTRLRGQLFDLAATLVEVSEMALGLAPGAMASQFAGVGMNVVAHWYPSYRVVGDSAAAGAVRTAPRTDFGTLSILDRRPSPAGLQILHQGEWIDVPVDRGCLTVKVGDLLEQWTAGRWPSSVHRIPGPSLDHPAEDHLTLVGFHRPAAKSVITPLDGSEPIECGPWLAERLAGAVPGGPPSQAPAQA